MKAVRNLLGWLARKGALYVAFTVAILAFAIWKSGDLHAIWYGSPSLHQQQIGGLELLKTQIVEQQRMLEAELVQAGQAAQTKSEAVIRQEIEEAENERDRLLASEPSNASRLFDAVRLDFDAIRRELERQLRTGFLNQKIRGLRAAAEAAANYESAVRWAAETACFEVQRLADQEGKVSAALEKARAAEIECTNAEKKLNEFVASRLETALDYLPFRDRKTVLQNTKIKRCKMAQAAENSVRNEQKKLEDFKAIVAGAADRIDRGAAWVERSVSAVTAVLNDRLVSERLRVGNTLAAKFDRFWTHYRIGNVFRIALGALALVIAMPFLIRIVCYFILAPLAMRRPAITLRVPDGTAVAIPAVPVSATSVTVQLAPDEELLVRQDFLQTSSATSAKGTQWFLDWRKPLTSIATGLTFLTRIRGDGEITTVSAVRDGLAEVTVLTLPESAAWVLHPRAIAAVAQPIRRRLRVTSHWRLGSLNAWLTLQLRYLVFHGPARLVLKGGRGVRVEQAARGRVFAQNQLVGFSADLAYSVTRTETFWPYFLGREQLLKERVQGGEGMLIVEEAPLSARGGEVRRGLEGMIDAGLKAFGI